MDNSNRKANLINSRGQKNGRIVIGLTLVVAILPAEFNWLYNPILVSSPHFFWLVDISRFIILPLLLLAWLNYRRLIFIDSLGFTSQIMGRKNIAIFIFWIIFVPIILFSGEPYLLAFVTKLYPHNSVVVPSFTYKEMLPPSGLCRNMAVSYMAMSAAFTEEILYRGLPRLLFGHGFLQAVFYILFSSVLFASVHIYGGMTKFIYAFSYGLISAFIYQITRNIWPLIFGHVLIDFSWLCS